MIAEKEYAKAIFDLASEENKCDDVLSDLTLVVTALKENEGYTNLLDTPALSKEERLSLIDEAFPTLDEAVFNLIKILCEKRSSRLIFGITKEFIALYDEKFGIVRVEAVTAREMSIEQKKKLGAALEAKLNKTVVIKNTIRQDILGGIRLRYLGVQLDASLKTRLDKIETSLKSVIV